MDNSSVRFQHITTGEVFRLLEIKKAIAGVVGAGLVILGSLAQAAPAEARAAAPCSSGSCTNFLVIGDLDYTEAALSGTFKGRASMALDSLNLCDEKSDQESATATITIALAAADGGQISYTTYRNAEYLMGPLAGCRPIDLLDYVAPSGWNLWATRADYDYGGSFGKAETTSHPQTYHTAWVYNSYLQV